MISLILQLSTIAGICGSVVGSAELTDSGLELGETMSNNEQKTTVYLVSRGSYDDYYIVGVFSTLEKAEEIASRYPRSDTPDIDDFVIDEVKYK